MKHDVRARGPSQTVHPLGLKSPIIMDPSHDIDVIAGPASGIGIGGAARGKTKVIETI